MGKVKKTKTNKKNGGGGNSSGSGGGQFSQQSSTELENKLASFDAEQRLQACAIMADLYDFNAITKYSLELLATPKLLSLLAMRLVDSTVQVRVKAAEALKNLSDCTDTVIFQRIVDVGILRSVVSLSFESVTVSALADNDKYLNDLFSSIENMLLYCNAASDELALTGKEFVKMLISLLDPTAMSSSVAGAAVALLRMLTNRSTRNAAIFAQHVGAESVTVFWRHIDTLKARAESDPSQGLIALQYAEIIANIFLQCTSTADPLVTACNISDIFKLLRSTFSSSAAALPFVQSSQPELSNSLSDASLCAATTLCMIMSGLTAQGNSGPAQEDEDGDEDGGLSIIRAFSTDYAEQRFLLVFSMLEAEIPLTMLFEAWNTINTLFNRSLVSGAAAAAAPFATGSAGGDAAAAADASRDAADRPQLLITDVAFQSLQSGEQLFSAIEEYVRCKMSYFVFTGTGSACSLQAPIMSRVMDDLLSAIDTTVTPDVLRASDTSSTCAYSEHISKREFQATLLKYVSTIADFVGSTVFRYSRLSTATVPIAPTDASVLFFLTEDELKTLAMSLIRALQCPIAEVSVHVASSTIAAFAVCCDNATVLSSTTPSITKQAHVFHPQVLTILSNALLQRLASPVAYFYVSAQADKAINSLKASALLMDACFNAIIDLHSSDNLEYFAAYERLKTSEKIQAAVTEFRQRVAGVAIHFDTTEREKIEGTLQNTDAFIPYKVDFARSMKR